MRKKPRGACRKKAGELPLKCTEKSSRVQGSGEKSVIHRLTHARETVSARLFSFFATSRSARDARVGREEARFFTGCRARASIWENFRRASWRLFHWLREASDLIRKIPPDPVRFRSAVRRMLFCPGLRLREDADIEEKFNTRGDLVDVLSAGTTAPCKHERNLILRYAEPVHDLDVFRHVELFGCSTYYTDTSRNRPLYVRQIHKRLHSSYRPVRHTRIRLGGAGATATGSPLRRT